MRQVMAGWQKPSDDSFGTAVGSCRRRIVNGLRHERLRTCSMAPLRAFTYSHRLALGFTGLHFMALWSSSRSRAPGGSLQRLHAVVNVGQNAQQLRRCCRGSVGGHAGEAAGAEIWAWVGAWAIRHADRQGQAHSWRRLRRRRGWWRRWSVVGSNGPEGGGWRVWRSRHSAWHGQIIAEKQAELKYEGAVHRIQLAGV